MLQVVVIIATLTACIIDAVTDVSTLRILYRQVMLLRVPRSAFLASRRVGA
jgi:hypothetical protein